MSVKTNKAFTATKNGDRGTAEGLGARTTIGCSSESEAADQEAADLKAERRRAEQAEIGRDQKALDQERETCEAEVQRSSAESRERRCHIPRSAWNSHLCPAHGGVDRDRRRP